MDRKGFTLAETLVAAVLIGVLAVILIPMLNKSSPDKDKIVFRKTYTTLAQAVTTMINDDLNYPNPPATGFNNTTHTTNVISGTTYYNKFCYFLADLLNTVGTTSCPNDSASGMITSPIFTTSDGVSWYIFLGGNDTTTFGNQFPVSFSSYGTYIVVDVNGANKAPNCMSDTSAVNNNPASGYTKCASSDPTNFPCQGNPDTFAIGVRYDGMLHAGYVGGRDYCAEYILSHPTENTKQSS